MRSFDKTAEVIWISISNSRLIASTILGSFHIGATNDAREKHKEENISNPS